EDNLKYDVSMVGSLYKEKDPFLKLKLGDDVKSRIDDLIVGQISTCTNGLSYIEDNLSDGDVLSIKNAADDFFPSDRSIMTMDRYVAINDYISPHIAYLERISILNDIACNTGGSVHLFTKSDVSDLDKGIHIYDGAKTLTEMPFVFRRSKINLNITMRSIQTGIPQRIWDVLACGGFLITNDQPEIHEYFKAGYHLETYSDHKELIEKIRYYLIHEDERREIARNGYEEVAEKHSVLQRVITMIKVIMSDEV
ncbi:MAG: glycosyltransferase family 1 protein, partial [Butyrivibrio sp.]|nr:glycosyltransferase family 1 protein [Butyrivibrio sp.]